MKKLIAILTLAIICVSFASAKKPKINPSTAANAAATAATLPNNNRQAEITDSLKAIQTRADNGDAAAMNEVGTWYYTGKHYKQDYKQAYRWWLKSAEAGNTNATGNLGLCFQHGRGVEKDSIKAINLYSKSIKMGNDALFRQREGNSEKDAFNSMLIGHCYENGVGVKTNAANAAKYYANAANLGSVDGMTRAGVCYLNSKDYRKAFDFFTKGSEKGDATSLFYVGKMRIEGLGVDPNLEQGFIHMSRAAEKGYPAAQNYMGELYLTGDKGTAQDVDKAAEWFEKAAMAGNKQGMWNYANVLKDGQTNRGKDYEQALFWYGEAGKEGYQRAFKRLYAELDSLNDPFAQYVEGMRLYLVKNNFEEANKLFKKVEKAKVDDGKVMQQIILADSKNPKANAKKAAKALEKLADSNPRAAFQLAIMYETGNGVDKNMDKAVEYLNKAVNAKYAPAMNYLGDLYYEGRGVNKDYGKATGLYIQAMDLRQLTEKGYTRLADCYENGLGGLPVDKKKAKSLRETTVADNTLDLLKSLPAK